MSEIKKEEEQEEWVKRREKKLDLGKLTIMQLLEELDLVEEKIREITDGDLMDGERFYRIKHTGDGLADYAYQIQEEIQKRLGVYYYERMKAHEDLIEELQEKVKGQQVAIDDLKEHEHSEETGKPVREIR